METHIIETHIIETHAYYGGHKKGKVAQENYGLVCVQLFGKDIPESPLR